MLENKLKELEGNLNTEDNIQSYNIYKKELDFIYDHIAEGIKIRKNAIGMSYSLLGNAFQQKPVNNLPFKSIGWFLYDTRYYGKAFPNRRYVKINPKNQELACRAF